MSRLAPVAFDLETTGFDPPSVITVAGFATEVGSWLVLNADGRAIDEDRLVAALRDRVPTPVELEVRPDEAGLLDALAGFAADRIDGDRHYLCAFNGETWRDGFDLPFLRTAAARHDLDWPFDDLAYADVRSMVDRFNTGDVGDLEGVYDQLVGRDHGDPFDSSEAAIAAFEAGEWEPLLGHNLADLTRTYELAVLAERYVPKSDFRMKNLAPPTR